jgi:ribosomal-protein-alanine N-acetyltransferase
MEPETTGTSPFRFHRMDEASARAILTWRYDAPYDFYNPDWKGVENAVHAFLDPQNACYCITNEGGDLQAYCCFGREAQVPGGDYQGEALDIGLGVRPDLTGQGRGHLFVQAVLDLAWREFSPAFFRVTVAEFNRRAQRVWMGAGFETVQSFARSGDGVPFLVLVSGSR